jgi:hypothetical protein
MRTMRRTMRMRRMRGRSGRVLYPNFDRHVIRYWMNVPAHPSDACLDVHEILLPLYPQRLLPTSLVLQRCAWIDNRLWKPMRNTA